jgi:hypothetical protein
MAIICDNDATKQKTTFRSQQSLICRSPIEKRTGVVKKTQQIIVILVWIHVMLQMILLNHRHNTHV